jgi:hypothetical protein
MRSFYQDRLGTNIGKVEETGVFIAAMIILIQGAFAGLMSQVRAGEKHQSFVFTALFLSRCFSILPRQARDKQTKPRSPT